MKKRNGKKLHKIWRTPTKWTLFGLVMGVVLATIGSVGALNGWFGGGGSIPSDTMTRGLVGYWAFDEGSGSIAYDSSGYANNGTTTNGPSWTNGKVGGALSFDGTDDYVGVAHSASLNITSAITLEAWVFDPPAETIQHADPAKKVQDPEVIRQLQQQGIDPDGVELFQDYASSYDANGNKVEGKSPYARFYKDLNSDKKFMAVSGLPMVNADGVPVEVGWIDNKDGSYTAKVNQFKATVAGDKVTLTVFNDQPDGKIKKDNVLIFQPQIWLADKEQKPFSKNATLLAVDPINPNYQNNTLEWDYGIAKRRLRLIEGSILGSWVFASNPNGEVRIKYNQAGDYRLKLGQYATDNDTEVISASAFVTDELGRPRQYPFTVADSATYYPDAAAVDGVVYRLGVNEIWATIRAGAGTGADSSGANDLVFYIYSSATANQWQSLRRSIFLFDTSGLPDSAIISAAVLSLRGYAKLDSLSITPSTNIYSSNPASNTVLAAADYNSLGSTAFSTDITYANWSTSAYNDFTLNSSGIAAISTTGISKFGGMNSQYDAANSAPAWSNGVASWVKCYYSEQGTGYKPKLVVTYTVPPPTGVTAGKGQDAYQLQINSSLNVVGYINNQSVTTTVTKAWHHIALTYDGSTQKIYQDGVLKDQASLSGSIGTNSTNLKIGEYVPGKIDEVRIYNRALSAAEVRYHYNRGGPVAQWSFDEGSGSVLYDKTENNNDGHLYLAPSGNTATSSAWVSGKYGSALSFDGVDDYVNLGLGSVGNKVNGAAAVTMSAWINISSMPSGGGSGRIINVKNYSGNNTGITLRLSGGNLQVGGRSITSDAYQSTDVSPPSLNVWHSVSGIIDYTNKKISIYIDGVQVQQGSATFNSNTYIEGTPTTNFDSIGSYDAGEFFNGLIDDVRIYNYVRTPEEIRLDYNAGFAALFGPQTGCDQDPGACMTNGLVGYWNFDEGSGTTAYDGSGNGKNGTLSGISATGGTITTSGGYTIHTFTSSGTFTVSGSGNVEVLVVAGGGGGGSNYGGGGGAGGLLYNSSFPVTAQAYTVTVGGGGAGGTGDASGSNGSNSVFSTITATGGGGGGHVNVNSAGSGGSGGGAGSASTGVYNGGAGTALQGNNGGSNGTTASPYPAGGGGGAGAVGAAGAGSQSGAGGVGLAYSISGAAVYYAGGGGGGSNTSGAAAGGGGNGGGGAGAGTGVNGNAGTANTGGGGGGSNSAQYVGGVGGSGIVIIRYTTGGGRTTGKVGGALQFNGVDDYVSVPTISIPNSITAEAWVYSSNFNQNGFIVQKAPVNTQWELFFEGSVLRWRGGAGENTVYCSIPSNNQWHHIVGTQSGTTGSLYIDGVFCDDGVVTAIGNGAGNIEIGRHDAPGYFFNGLIDEVRIYNRALSDAEVRYHYNRGGPVAQWKMDEGTGRTVYDSTENNNDGTLVLAGSATSSAWVAGKNGTALSFDGVDDYVDCGQSTTLVVEKMTLEAWIKEPADLSSNRQIVVKQLAPTNRNYSFDVEGGTGRLAFRFSVGGISNTLLGVTALNDNKWHHVVATYDREYMKIYIDGVIDASVVQTGIPDTPTSNVYIGTYGGERWFNGLIDDVRIYNYARTPDEIRLDYNAGFAALFGPQTGCDRDPGACMTQGLVGYWNFDEGSGSIAYDVSGNGNNGSVLPDVVCASGHTDNGNGTCTATFYPDADPESASVDGWVDPHDGTNYTWANVRSNAGKRAFGSETAMYVQIQAAVTSNTWYNICRAVTLFDTSSLPDNANITAAVLSLYGSDKIDGLSSSPTINIYSSNPTSNTQLAITDYDISKWGSTAFSTEITYANWSLSGYNNFTLNSSGLAAISKTGVSKFGARNANYDVANVAPTWASGSVYFYLGSYTAEQAGTSQDPKLVVTYGRAPAWESGKVGGALQFNGVDNYVNIGINAYNLGIRRSATFAGWVYPRSLISNSAIVSDWNSEIGMNLRIDNNASATFYVYPNNHRIVVSYTFSVNTWYYLVGVMDGADMYLYINGVQVGSTTLGEDIGSSAETLKIGRRGDGGSSDAVIDEVRIYNRALSAAEVRYHYNRGGPVGYWKFDEGEGRTVYDSTENNNDGTLVLAGSATSSAWVAGKFGSALSFDGVDDYVNAGDPTNGSLDFGTGSFTATLWVKANAFDANDYLYEKGFWRTGVNGYGSKFSDSNGTLHFYASEGTPSADDLYVSQFFSAGQWYHIAEVYDKTNLKMYIYVNGLQKSQRSITTTASTNLNNSYNFYIGAYNGDSLQMNGLIDDVRIYNYARNQDQIRQDYNAGLSAHFK